MSWSEELRRKKKVPRHTHVHIYMGEIKLKKIRDYINYFIDNEHRQRQWHFFLFFSYLKKKTATGSVARLSPPYNFITFVFSSSTVEESCSDFFPPAFSNNWLIWAPRSRFLTISCRREGRMENLAYKDFLQFTTKFWEIDKNLLGARRVGWTLCFDRL